MAKSENALTVVTLKQTIHNMVGKQELPLPKNISQEAFTNAAVVAFTDNPDIAKCDAGSVFKSIRKIAGMGLVPDGHEAALVPFNTKVGESYVKMCQAMPMVAGLIKRARNSGEISTIWSEIVYEGEEIRVWAEDGERRWDHSYNPMRRGTKVVGVYAVAKLRDGTIEFESMDLAEIEKIRGISKSNNGPAWKTWFTEMARKSVIRRMCKRLPMSADARAAIVESDSDTIGDLKDVTPSRPSLQDKLDARETPHDESTGEVLEIEAEDPAFEGRIYSEEEAALKKFKEEEEDK